MKKGPCANPAAMVELRLASLKPQLNLTPDQEQSWNAMLDRIRESSKSLEAAGAASRMPTPAEMEGVRVATDRFYASLSPEQPRSGKSAHSNRLRVRARTRSRITGPANGSPVGLAARAARGNVALGVMRPASPGLRKSRRQGDPPCSPDSSCFA
jgi:hypothetical protein